MNNFLISINSLVCMFLPPLFFAYNEEKDKNINIIYKFITYLLFINFICYFIVIFIYNNSSFIFDNLFTLKYIFLSMVIGFIIRFIRKNKLIEKINKLFKKYFEIRIRIDKNENYKKSSKKH